jgi:hypothetical protein
MFAYLFSLIRRYTRDAVLAGFSDAVAEIQSDETCQEAVAALADRAKALPAPEKKGRKP